MKKINYCKICNKKITGEKYCMLHSNRYAHKKIGHIVLNQTRIKISKTLKKYFRLYKNGFEGKKHTKQTIKQMKIKATGRIGYWKNKKRPEISGRKSPRFGKSSHGRWERYKNKWFRSSYEVIYARYLDKNNIKWQYESKTFDLGNTTYTPDFYLPKFNLYIEIKGWWRNDAKKKFRLFKKIYNNIKIKIIDSDMIKQLKEDKNESNS